MQPVAKHQVVVDLNAPVPKRANLFHDLGRMHHDTRPHDINHVGIENAARDVVQFVRFVAADHGMAGVGAALVANHDLKVLGQQVNQLSLRLVTPLQTDHAGPWHGKFLNAFNHDHGTGPNMPV